jgi:hypothetical protein
MMLKKGIVRRRATQSASRSRRNRENKAMRPLSRHVGSGGSAMMESLTSTLDRAKMKKSLLEWGDDDSILLKPYPIESFESGVMLPGGVLD